MTAQRKLCVEISAIGRAGIAFQQFLIALECLQRDQRFVMGFAERYIPYLAFKVSGIDRLGKDAVGLFVRQDAMPGDGETRMGFPEAFDLGL
nr:hypothetical protein [Sphingobium sp. AS12]